MNIFEFNHVIYKGNINIKFFLHCLKKDPKLIKYIFINIWYLIVSTIIISKKDLYETKKFNYLKDIKNLNKEIKIFTKKSKYKVFLDDDKDLIIDKVPKMLIEEVFNSSKICAYEFDENYNVDLKLFNDNLNKIKKCNKLYLRNRFHYLNIKGKKTYIVFHNTIRYIKHRHKLKQKFLYLLICILLSLIITCLSFAFTSHEFMWKFYLSYFEKKLFLLNIIILFF